MEAEESLGDGIDGGKIAAVRAVPEVIRRAHTDHHAEFLGLAHGLDSAWPPPVGG